MVAVRAQEGSTRTVGYTFLQLLYGLLTYGGFDRLLNGPTNDVWLQLWVTYLRAKGVKFCNNTLVKSFAASEAGITSVVAENNGQELTITADYYISAMPVEAMTPLVDDRMKALAPSLANLNKIYTAWMNGIQYYLNQDMPLEFGHSLYADSPWALTSISQKQFWKTGLLSEFGDGRVGGILSVDISDWEVPGIVYGKPAMQCSASEIEKEAWEQIKVHVNVAGSGGTAGPEPVAVVPGPRRAISESDGSHELGAADDQYVGLFAIPARGEHGDSKFVLSFRLCEDVYGCSVYGGCE